MDKETFKLYLSKDIVQGEEVPFYLIWERDDVIKIIIEFDGFEQITEYHNVIEDFSTEDRVIKKEDLKTKHYFGGVLKTSLTGDPFKESSLKVTFELDSGEVVSLEEHRILYSTILEVSKLPKRIKLPFEEPPMEIKFKGLTTVFVDIHPDVDNEVNFELLPEIKNAIEQFLFSLREGLMELRKIYPQYDSFFEVVLSETQNSNLISETKLEGIIEVEFEKVKPDVEFQRAIQSVVNNAAKKHESIKDSIIRPLLDYLEASAADRVFLDVPFLHLNVPKGVSHIKGIIYYVNILEKEGSVHKNSNEGTPFETIIESDENVLIPVKDFVKIERVCVDG